MEWQIVASVAALLLPPGCLLALALVGALVARWRPRVGRALVATALLLLYALSTPFASDRLIALLEPAERNPLADRSGQAIVVLGGGAYFAAPEYGKDTVGVFTLARVRYAARLHRELKAPILLSGGAPLGNAGSEAEMMERVLTDELGISAKWLEKQSRNTLENARYTQRMLGPLGVKRIYLVTNAWHMPRARLAFEKSGFSVIPAATGYNTRFTTTVVDFMPSASGMSSSSWLFHEIIGIGWYHLRLFIGR